MYPDVSVIRRCIWDAAKTLGGTTVSPAFHAASCGAKDQARENPPEDEQDEEDVVIVPPLVIEPPEEKVENNTSVSPWPQDGQCTLSFSSLQRHKYSKILSQFLHLNSCTGTLMPLVNFDEQLSLQFDGLTSMIPCRFLSRQLSSDSLHTPPVPPPAMPP